MSNQITYAAFEAAFMAKHGVRPSEFRTEKRGDAWREKMRVLDTLAVVPTAPETQLEGSCRGCYPFGPDHPTCGYSPFSIPVTPTYGDFGAIGEESVVACAGRD